MSLSLNQVLIAGRITRDPVVRMLANENAVADFGLAMNHSYKAKDGTKKEEVTFVDVECWGRNAEFVGQYFTKGSAAFVQGRLKLDTWDDKDGGKRSKLKIVADDVRFVESKGEAAGTWAAGASSADAGKVTKRPVAVANADETVPF